MAKRDIIIRHSKPFMELDPYVTNNHHYEVRSIYFDSPFRKAFFDKTNGIKTRVKLRIRYYPDFQNGENELVFIELKKKNNENVSKSRILVPFEDAFKIIDNKTPEAKNYYKNALAEDKSNLNEIWYLYNRYNLKPVCVVCYQRQPYMSKIKNRFRMTFDTNIRVRNYNFNLHVGGDTSRYIIPPHISVMELKFNSFIPNWAIKILQRNDVLQEKMSKFASGLSHTRTFGLV